MRAGEVATAAGVNLDTLRYYERRGILPEPARTPGGHRHYEAEAVTTLRIIKALQRAGFTLSEVHDLLNPKQHRRRPTDPDLQAAIGAKLANIEQRIADLDRLRATLMTALGVGCDDLDECAATPACPLPFTGPDPTTTSAHTLPIGVVCFSTYAPGRDRRARSG